MPYHGRDDTVHNRIPARGRDIIDSELPTIYSLFTIFYFLFPISYSQNTAGSACRMSHMYNNTVERK